MAEDKFKLPRSSYEELCKIVKAYGRLTQPASLEDVAKLCAMNKTAISANNAFLTNVELIEGGRTKAASAQGRALAKALEHELPNQIQESWAEVVNGNEFLDKMAAAVKIRGKMDSSALESHIAYSAGETKSAPVMTGARAVVDILRAAGVVSERDGQLVAGGNIVGLKATSEITPETATYPTTQKQVVGVARVPLGNQAGVASLHIELRIDAKPSELDGLGKKIRELLQELDSSVQAEGDDLLNDS